MTAKQQVQSYIDAANAATGAGDTTCKAVVERLIAGYGEGGTLPAYKVTETGHVFWQDMDLADVTGVFQFSDAHDNPNFHSVRFGGMPCVGDDAFRYLSNFERAEFLLKSGGDLTNSAGTAYRVFRDIRSLKTVILGSVGHPVTNFGGLYRFFSGCTQNDLTITIYVNAASVSGIDPAVNALAPWGAANATIIYRSSVTGEVLE